MSLYPPGWPEHREPAPPEEFDPWAGLEVDEDPVPVLLEAGMESLDRALVRGTRDRAAAFLLLEADGYVTYACEAATEAPGTEERLLEILKTVGSRGR